MHISRKLREALEGKLPPIVLEALNEKFQEAEKYCEDNKLLRQRMEWLERQLEMKDSQLMQMYSQGQNQGSIGFKQQGSGGGMNSQQQQPYGPPQIFANYNPQWPAPYWSDQGPQYRGKRGRGNRGVYAQGGGGSSGGGGGSSSGGGGVSAAYDPYQYDEFSPMENRGRGGVNENPKITGPGDAPRE